jgi:purine-binding chemotaxis protein CheW
VEGNDPADQTDRVLLVFEVASAWFGVDPQVAQELAPPQVPTPVPRAPDYVAGLVALRGRAVPLLDLQRFLALDPRDARGTDDDLLKRIVVVASDGMTVGIVCDRVRSLVRLPRNAFLPPESLPAGRVRDFAESEVADPAGVVTKVGGIVVVLKVPELLEAARLRPAASIA